MSSSFTFLEAEWPDVYEAASRAAAAVHPDPRTACFYARRALELAVGWVYRADAAPWLRTEVAEAMKASAPNRVDAAAFGART